jgi:hypothetical protein
MKVVARVQWVDLLSMGSRHTWPTTQWVNVLPPEAQQCLLVWRDENSESPPLLIVANGELEGLYAWVATYASHLVPLSGSYEVVEWASYEPSEQELPPSDAAGVLGALGVVHAEATAACGGEPPAWAGLTPFLSTCSWPMFQSLLRALRTDGEDHLARSWAESRDLLRAAPVEYDTRSVSEVWRIIRLLLTDESTERITASDAVGVRFLASMKQRGLDDSDEILRQYPTLVTHLPSLRTASIDRRVDAFKALLPDLMMSGRGDVLPPMLAGYALSLISQGSFRHVRMVLADRVPDVRLLLWYGWFDFLRDAPNPGAPGTASVSQRLRRILSGPVALPDIALEELRVLSRSRNGLTTAMIDVRHPMRVGLLPQVNAVVQPRVHFKGNDRPPRQRQLV